jgi:hypothetical protein
MCSRLLSRFVVCPEIEQKEKKERKKQTNPIGNKAFSPASCMSKAKQIVDISRDWKENGEGESVRAATACVVIMGERHLGIKRQASTNHRLISRPQVNQITHQSIK